MNDCNCGAAFYRRLASSLPACHFACASRGVTHTIGSLFYLDPFQREQGYSLKRVGMQLIQHAADVFHSRRPHTDWEYCENWAQDMMRADIDDMLFGL